MEEKIRLKWLSECLAWAWSFFFWITVAWHAICFGPSNAKDNKRKINKLYLSGGIAKILRCYLFGVLRRTSTEIFASPVPPQLLVQLPLKSSSLVPKLISGHLSSAAGGRDNPSTQHDGVIVGLLAEEFQEEGGKLHAWIVSESTCEKGRAVCYR